MTNVCFSGGADGADLLWGFCAKEMGHQVIHWGFAGHKSQADKSDTVILSEKDLALADERLLIAGRSIRRRYPPRSSYVKKLLQRNWYQVADTSAVYAVAAISDSIVTGGTSWAVQMYIDLVGDGPALSCWVYDQYAEQWFQRDSGFWIPVATPPKPDGSWTGIGSRNLLDSGIRAILDLTGVAILR